LITFPIKAALKFDNESQNTMIAAALLILLGAYLGCGLVFAIPFAFFGVQKIDPHAAHGPRPHQLSPEVAQCLYLFRPQSGLHPLGLLVAREILASRPDAMTAGIW